MHTPKAIHNSQVDERERERERESLLETMLHDQEGGIHMPKATHFPEFIPREFKSASFNGTSTGASINGRPFLNIPKLWMDGSTPRGRRVARKGGGGGGQGGVDEVGGPCVTDSSEVTSVTIYESSRLALPFMLEVCVCEREIDGERERERERARERERESEAVLVMSVTSTSVALPYAYSVSE
jgi:hypothetical protein